jgi:CBS domain-containing protein
MMRHVRIDPAEGPGEERNPAVPLAEAMCLMADRRIGALPVVEGGRVVTALARRESA